VSLAFIVIRISRRRATRTEENLVALFTIGVLAWWFMMHRVPRFALPILVLSCLLSVPVLAILHAARKKAFEVLFVVSVLASCGISGLIPSVELGKFIRTGGRTRAEFYAYPKIIDELPAGSRILNYTRILQMNFPLAGDRLTNRVVASFEAPDELNPASLNTLGIEFIAEILRENSQVPQIQPMEGIFLLKTEVVRSGASSRTWRIWRVGGSAGPNSD
jgi:hypothetical protein